MGKKINGILLRIAYSLWIVLVCNCSEDITDTTVRESTRIPRFLKRTTLVQLPFTHFIDKTLESAAKKGCPDPHIPYLNVKDARAVPDPIPVKKIYTHEFKGARQRLHQMDQPSQYNYDKKYKIYKVVNPNFKLARTLVSPNVAEKKNYVIV